MQHAQTKAAPLPARSLQKSSPLLARLGRLGAVLSCSFALVACGSSADSADASATVQDDAATGQLARPDYQRAMYDPIHFKPAIESATDEQCLACHQEVLAPSVRTESLAGVQPAQVKAWYQDLSTYAGDQETFHRRHLVTPYAKQVMDLKCNTCHQGNDPREEAPGSSATNVDDNLRLRKHVDVGEVCLMCHAKMNFEVMGLPEPWQKSKALFNNDCLMCHAAIRTNRHQVNFLKPEAIEAAAQGNGDVCFGCHGGRAWYQMLFPYPRHPWPGGEEVPDWAKDRPTTSLPRFLTGLPAQSAAAADAAQPAATEPTPADSAADTGAQQ